MFVKCIELQNRFNSNTSGEDWKESENDYAYEAIMELIEAGNSVPHKWWGKEELDKENFILELIDTTHFGMSNHLASPFYCSYEDLNKTMNEAYDMFGLHVAPPLAGHNFKTVKNIIKSATKHLLSGYDKRHVTGFWVDIMKLFKIAGVDKKEIVTRYLIKNCLNKLRQIYGYKSGNYCKMLPSSPKSTLVEDNVIMTSAILNSTIELDFEVVYREIEKLYNYHRVMESDVWDYIEHLDKEVAKTRIQEVIDLHNLRDIEFSSFIDLFSDAYILKYNIEVSTSI